MGGSVDLWRAPRCPTCRARRIEPVQHGSVEIDLCRRCGTLWFDGGELEEALCEYDVDLEAGCLARWIGPDLGPREGTCLRCSSPLVQHELQRCHEAKVDVCPTCHGMALPAGELGRLQANHQLREAEATVATKTTVVDWLFQFLTGLPREFNFRPRRVPMVTWSLIILNVAFFLAQQADPQHFLEQLALWPERAFGSSWWLGLVTHNLMHVNLVHLGGNMYFLWILGDNVEDLFGRWNFLLFCAGAALCSGFAETLFAVYPEIPTVGFSGVVSAILVAYAILFRHAKLTFMFFIFQVKLGALWYVGIWAAFNIAGLVLKAGAISFLGHLGGAAFGLVVSLALYRRFLRRDPLLRLLRGVAFHEV